ncbi:MAG: YdcF family protein [Candidatus Aminicenantes bacterium]|nr:YdcF family protein [Candidatus Aminicenantes bacterium]
MKKIKILLLIFFFLLLLFLLTDIYLLLLKPLDTGHIVKKQSGDIILVLGGGLKAGNEIGVSTAERLEQALDIYKTKKMKILVSDGSLYKKSPAIKMFRDFLTKKGVASEHILFEGKSQTTFENFLYTKSIIREENSDEILVCTSPYHQMRSEVIIDHMKLDNYRVVKMDRSEVYQAGSVKQRLRNLRLVIREYFGLLKFKIFKR